MSSTLITNIFLLENTTVRCTFYLNHTGRKEYDCVMFRRRPNQEGPFYICYYSDVPAAVEGNPHTIHVSAKYRNVLEVTDIHECLDYVEDMLGLMELDKAPFKTMEVDSAIYPTVIVNPIDLIEHRRLILRCIEDSLRSNRIVT